MGAALAWEHEAMSTATLEDITRAVITGLRTATWVPNPANATRAPAPWGDRVHLRRSSKIVEVPDGAVEGSSGPPAQVVYPCLYLFGPEVIRQPEFDADASRESLSEDRDAGTRTVRAWPRRVRLRFTAVFLTRDGKTGAPTTAEAQAFAATTALSQWLRANPSIFEAQVFEVDPLDDATERVNAADLVRRQGVFELRQAMVYLDGPHEVPISTTFRQTVAPLPEGEG